MLVEHKLLWWKKHHWRWIRALLDLNVVGTISVTKAVLPHMIKQREGQIVVVSSLVGKFGVPFRATYCASKHALQGYFDSARLELAEHNIHVQTVLPGPVESNISRHIFTENISDELKDSSRAFQEQIMPTERCAKLMAVGMVNNLDEVWISQNPALLTTYLNQYLPNFYRWISKKLFMEIMRKGITITKP